MIYILAEGHGEIEALPKLAYKICHNIGLHGLWFSKARRCVGIHKRETLKKEIRKMQYAQNISGLLIVKDSDDACPKELAPNMATIIQTNPVDFPIAYCLMYREFETIFYAYLDHFSGMHIGRSNLPGTIVFKDDIVAPDNPEDKRDAKGALSDAIVNRAGYKPSTDQLALTEALDIEKLRQLEVPCFGTFERCILHLANNTGQFSVYPKNPLL
jgi:hypothetical protein